MTVAADRQRRRQVWYAHASNGIYLEGHEYGPNVITAHEREAAERSVELHQITDADLHAILEGFHGGKIAERPRLRPRKSCLIESPETYKIIYDFGLRSWMMSKKRQRPTSRQLEVYPEDSFESSSFTQHIDLSATSRGHARSTYVTTAGEGPRVPPPPPEQPQWSWNTEPILSTSEDNIFSSECLDPDYEHEPIVPSDKAEKRRRTTAMDHPLLLWDSAQIDLYIHESLRADGCADAPMECARHPEYKGELHRCLTCVNGQLMCPACIVEDHKTNPFHRIQKWIGTYFENTTFYELGYQLNLGHLGDSCRNPRTVKVAILHVNGIHQLRVNFCNCTQAVPEHVQLLRARLFPSTTIYPQTAATFELLRHFQLLSFMSKVSAFEFYQTLVRLTDNTGTLSIPDRYREFLRMLREWRHLKLLKRGARGYDPKGVEGTKPGECAVLCPACPYPGINMPADLSAVASNQRWLYRLFLGIDANFRLKRLKVSTEDLDPGLNRGFAYCVERTAFQSYLKKYGKAVEDDTSTCNNHDAIKSASVRGGKGVDASGVGKVECARHDMKRPIAIGDLQEGEKYINMDYFFFSTLSFRTPPDVVLSYDIVCQWFKSLASRASLYGRDKFKDHTFTFLVPKFHLAAHIPHCQVSFSFNFTPNVGRTDGEAPERGWAAINAISSSTKEMGPGSRRDTLDDHFGDYNWRKVISIAATFLRKGEEAIVSHQEHTDAFDEFSAALPTEDVAKWTQLVELWEKDNSNFNPFAATIQKISENAVRLELAEEDAAQLKENVTNVLHDDVPPSRLIAQGLELEDHQHALQVDIEALGKNATDLQRTKVVERSNRLYRKIEAWITIQTLYMPHVAIIRSRAESAGGDEPPSPLTIDILLPSAVIQQKGPCDTTLLEYEWRLRYAQAHGCLDEIRRAILLRSRMYKTKDSIIRGQRMNTRSNTLIQKVSDRVETAAKKYRRVRSALTSLASRLSKVGWESELQPLTAQDIKGISREESDESEGRRTLPWIWRTATGIDKMDDAGKEEALRIEWCKARARAHRWREECSLLQEEMRRVIAFFTHKETSWLEQASNSHPHVSPTTAAGLKAYALRQAKLYARFRVACVDSWHGLSDRLLESVKSASKSTSKSPSKSDSKSNSKSPSKSDSKSTSKSDSKSDSKSTSKSAS
ncbi:hypothetical protein H0H93_013691 [Arthromyces matolae]|nr:hypothetical protein H0H93_013691 [Arthromyces matolae]